MTDEHEVTADEDGADDRVLDSREVRVDGGDLPKFEPAFTLERWETDEGPVVGVRYHGPDVASPEQRVAYVRAAMEHHDG